MLIFILFMMCLGIEKEEIYEYQINLIITQQNEDFLIAQQDFAHPRNQDQRIQKFDPKVVLIRETNHSIDHIIDMKLNEFESSNQVWVLQKIDNQSILSKQSLEEISQQKYYLNLNYQCYTFYFKSKFQIIIDCQYQGSNILVLYDFQHKVQQSYFYFYYKKVSLRKLLQICLSDTFVLIQQEKLLILCRQQNKYQVCNQIDFHNNAHTVYIKQQELYLISDQYLDVFEINIENSFEFIYIKNQIFSELGLGVNFPILYYYNLYKYSYFILSNQITICKITCQTNLFEGHPLKIYTAQNYLIIQTNVTILLINMLDQQFYSIKQIFDNEYVVVNIIFQEFLILNKVQEKLFGISNRAVFRIQNQKQIIDQLNPQNNLINIIYNLKDKILFYHKFQFKVFSDLQQANFVLVGGLLDIEFIVEDMYKNVIRLHHNHFKKTKYQNVQYFWIYNKMNKESIIVLQQDGQTLYNQSQESEREFSTIKTDDYKNIQLIQSFNDAYLMLNVSNGLKFIMIIVSNLINIVKYDFTLNSTPLKCNNQFCISQMDNMIFIKQFHVGPDIKIMLAKYDRYLHYDVVNRVLYLINDNQIITKYYYDQRTIYIQSIQICSHFIDIVVLQYKLVLVCQEQMILYNKISNFRYVLSGNIELYGQTFTQSSLVIQNDYNLFYIIDNDTMHVFNSNLPLTQLYVTKMKIGKFDDVKSQNQHICFQYKHNLDCYYYQVNIKFNYDDDLVEYHQAFKVDICGKNIYNKKCKQYITRLDQQNRKIQIKKTIQQLLIKQDILEILFNKSWVQGTIEKVYVDNQLLKTELQFYDILQMNEYVGGTYYYSFDGSIYIINNYNLLFYQIETKQVNDQKPKKK